MWKMVKGRYVKDKGKLSLAGFEEISEKLS
jgi:hypothetical protein